MKLFQLWIIFFVEVWQSKLLFKISAPLVSQNSLIKQFTKKVRYLIIFEGWLFFEKFHWTLSSIFRGLTKNKPAAQAAGQTLPNATPPVGKIHPFSKIAVTIEPTQQFRGGRGCNKRFHNSNSNSKTKKKTDLKSKPKEFFNLSFSSPKYDYRFLTKSGVFFLHVTWFLLIMTWFGLKTATPPPYPYPTSKYDCFHLIGAKYDWTFPMCGWICSEYNWFCLYLDWMCQRHDWIFHNNK